jgi:hypothetical protein
MEKGKTDILKIKQALFIKEMAECVPVIGGGIALIILAYPFWGILCILAGSLGVLSELAANKAPKPSRAMGGFKLFLEMLALIAGGITLILLGQLAGGIACIGVCAVRTVMGLLVMPLIEKRYEAA